VDRARRAHSVYGGKGESGRTTARGLRRLGSPRGEARKGAQVRKHWAVVRPARSWRQVLGTRKIAIGGRTACTEAKAKAGALPLAACAGWTPWRVVILLR